MLCEINRGHEKITLHYVDDDVKARAQFSQAAFELGYHCELYDSFAEMSGYHPQHGIIFFRDTPSVEGFVAGAFTEMRKAGIWLAAVVVGSSPAPAQIVEAIKAGALDYLSLPMDVARLQRCLARTADEATRISGVRRKSIEAHELIKMLSPREAEVLELLSEGHSNKSIARELNISPHTVEIHRANMMSKLGATHSEPVLKSSWEISASCA